MDPVVVRRLQRRTLGVLSITQTVGGIGLAVGIAVGALLTARMGTIELSGLGQSAMVVGTALLAIPMSRIMTTRGRRPGLGLAYLVGAVGAVLVVVAAARDSVALLFVGLFLFGGGSTANFQSRYAAVDLAEPKRRGRQLSLVVWATTIGSVAGPNLAGIADDSVHRFGVAEYSGPFVFSGIAFVIAAGIVLFALRPDPLLTARALAAEGGDDRTGAASDRPGRTVAAPAVDDRTASASLVGDRTAAAVADPERTDPPPAPSGLRAAAREVRASAGARLGLAAVVVGHVVMISVMAMTPVHIGEVHETDSLKIVGFVISVHIAGMYALSPVTGWLADRLGRRRVIIGGIALLVAGCAVAGLSGPHTGGLTVGLCLLGMGWSGTMVSGSTLLTESVGLGNRASIQGLSDLVMGLGGATAGALSGLIVGWASYGVLTVVAAVVTVPLLAAVLRPAAAQLGPPALGGSG